MRSCRTWRARWRQTTRRIPPLSRDGRWNRSACLALLQNHEPQRHISAGCDCYRRSRTFASAAASRSVLGRKLVHAGGVPLRFGLLLFFSRAARPFAKARAAQAERNDRFAPRDRRFLLLFD